MIKRWVGHTARMEQMYTKDYVRKNCEGKTPLEYPCPDEGVDWINWITTKFSGRLSTTK
jgi:hypothetical protein